MASTRQCTCDRLTISQLTVGFSTFLLKINYPMEKMNWIFTFGTHAQAIILTLTNSKSVCEANDAASYVLQDE